MAERGFRQAADTAAVPDAMLLLKRQTRNTNRAVVVVSPAHVPTDSRRFSASVSSVR